MATLSIVKHLYVLEQIGSGFVPVAVADPDHPLALEYTELRALSRQTSGEEPGTEANILKIRGTEIQQRITELALEAVGTYANPYVPEALKDGWNEEPIGPEYAAGAAPRYFNWRKASIYGGSNEIQKGIVAKLVLEL